MSRMGNIWGFFMSQSFNALTMRMSAEEFRRVQRIVADLIAGVNPYSVCVSVGYKTRLYWIGHRLSSLPPAREWSSGKVSGVTLFTGYNLEPTEAGVLKTFFQNHTPHTVFVVSLSWGCRITSGYESQYYGPFNYQIVGGHISKLLDASVTQNRGSPQEGT